MKRLSTGSMFIVTLAALLIMPEFASGQVRTESNCGPPPPPPPAQRASAESIPPLPLPVTPMRRTEKKKPPEPPVIITKIRTDDVRDWATDENDVNNLLIWMKTNLKLNFTWDVKTIEELEFDPTRMPAIYRTGHFAFSFTPKQRHNLRQYAINGGLIIFDSCCGRDEFAQSVKSELQLIFPEATLELLPPDHPLYRCYYDITQVNLTNGQNVPPPVYGIDIGCRTAVIFSPYDMSCGWDMHQHNDTMAIHYDDALKLGANLIAYSTSTKAMGMSLAESRIFVDADTTRWDKFRVAQIVHEGQWNPDPAGLSTLLDTIAGTTTIRTSFDRAELRLSDPAIGAHPFLYMTGHKDFELTDEEVLSLRRYLQNGGFLLADACCGREGFDLAFREQIKRVLPDAPLQSIPANHAIYRRPTQITSVQYTPTAQAQMKDSTAPALEGITVDGKLAVVYSRHDLGCGWELKPHPYAMGYEARSAINLGINIVLYAMTH